MSIRESLLFPIAIGSLCALGVAQVAEVDPPARRARPALELVNGDRDLLVDHGPGQGLFAILVGDDPIDGPLPRLGDDELLAFSPRFTALLGRLDGRGFAWRPIDLQDPVAAGLSLQMQALVADAGGGALNSSQPIRVEFRAASIEPPQLPAGQRVAFAGAARASYDASGRLSVADGRIPEVACHVEVTVPTGGHALRVGAVEWFEDLARVTVTVVAPPPGAIVTEALEVLEVDIPLGTRCDGIRIDLEAATKRAELSGDASRAGIGAVVAR